MFITCIFRSLGVKGLPVTEVNVKLHIVHGTITTHCLVTCIDDIWRVSLFDIEVTLP